MKLWKAGCNKTNEFWCVRSHGICAPNLLRLWVTYSKICFPRISEYSSSGCTTHHQSTNSPTPYSLCKHSCDRFHIYIIGTEECERSIAQSALFPSKKGWEAYLNEAMGPSYIPIRSHTLQVRTPTFSTISCTFICCSVYLAANRCYRYSTANTNRRFI